MLRQKQKRRIDLRPLGRLDSATDEGVGRTSFSVAVSRSAGLLSGEPLTTLRSASVREGDTLPSEVMVADRLISRDAASGEPGASCEEDIEDEMSIVEC